MASDPQGPAGAPGEEDLYEVLGLFPTASPEDIDAAYHRLLNGLIATVANTGEAAERLRRRRIRLAHAYAVLADPEQRAAYNARLGLSAAQDGEPPPPTPMPTVAPAPTAPPPVSMPVVPPPTAEPVQMPDIVPPAAAAPEPVVELPEPPPPAAVTPDYAPVAVPEELDLAPAVTDMTTTTEESAPVVVEVRDLAPEIEQATPEADPLTADSPAAVDDTPAPWETAAVAAPALPVIKERPLPRRPPGERRPPVPGAGLPPTRSASSTTAPVRPAPAAPVSARPIGGVALPSRKVAEATPLPSVRSRFAEETRPLATPVVDEEEEEDIRPRTQRRALAEPAPVRARPRPQPAPAPRRSKKNRSNMMQTIFYATMAIILAVGTIGGLVSTIITPGGSAPIATTAPGTNTGAGATASAAGDAALTAANYTEAISQYNQALSLNNGTDTHALLGLAKAYYYKTPSEPDIAREYLARVFQADTSASTPDGKEALQLLTTIGVPQTTGTPGTPAAGTPASGTAGTAAPGTAAGTSVPGTAATPGTGATAPAATGAPLAPGAPGPSTAAPGTTRVP